MERAAKLEVMIWAGLDYSAPIIETQAGDVSAYIPTNVFHHRRTDFFGVRCLFFTGQRPAINVGISVSRVGGNAQIKSDEAGFPGKLKLELAQYLRVGGDFRSLVRYRQDTKARLDHGKVHRWKF